MSKSDCCCQNPEKLKKRPEDCTPEQKRECHGDTDTHVCQGHHPESTDEKTE